MSRQDECRESVAPVARRSSEGMDRVRDVLAKIRRVDAEHVWALGDGVLAAGCGDPFRVVTAGEERRIGGKGHDMNAIGGGDTVGQQVVASETRRCDDVVFWAKAA